MERLTKYKKRAVHVGGVNGSSLYDREENDQERLATPIISSPYREGNEKHDDKCDGVVVRFPRLPRGNIEIPRFVSLLAPVVVIPPMPDEFDGITVREPDFPAAVGATDARF